MATDAWLGHGDANSLTHFVLKPGEDAAEDPLDAIYAACASTK